MRNSCCEDGQADADGRTDGEDGGVMHPAFISSIFPSLLFSVSLFGTRKEGRKEGRKERREGRSSGRGNKEVLSRLRLWWRRSVGGDVGKSGGGLTNDRLNDLPFTVLRPFSRRPRVTLSFTAQIQPERRPRPFASLVRLSSN